MSEPWKQVLLVESLFEGGWFPYEMAGERRDNWVRYDDNPEFRIRRFVPEEDVATERARAETYKQQAIVNGQRRDMEREMRETAEQQLAAERARAEAAEGREARLRFLLTKTALTVVVDSGGVNAWHCRVCFGTARSGQSPLHLRSCEYVAALAGTPEGEQ